MRSGFSKLAPFVVVALCAVGCTPRFKGGEAFVGATTPVDYAANRKAEGAWKGDPYAFGGTADASGGLEARTNYGAGARPNATEPLDTRLSQPMKGIGQNAGEYPAWADPSHGNTNAPFAQPSPSAAGPVNTAR
jgi:hypothetical protein